MKSFFVYLLCLISIKSLDQAEQNDLSELSKRLYEAEDKLEHILYHFNHDLTRHEYKGNNYATFLAPSPLNPNSIHQKLKVLDNLNFQSGSPSYINFARNNAYNEMLGGPAMPIPVSRNGRPKFFK